VVVNNTGGNLVSMTGARNGDITIPCVMVSQATGNALVSAIHAGNVNGLIRDTFPTGSRYDSGLDLGVIAHEYGHGVSKRLTCGPSFSGGLTNSEQMGEGWSDFFALAFTARQGDVGSTPRGIAAHLRGQTASGPGIRTYPYSTNLSINPHTYKNIERGFVNGTLLVHYIGEIWCATLWDLYWEMVARYGFDANLSRGNGGNNRCVYIVVEAMKYQACQPGFIDGRDALLKADSLLYGAANQDLIWKVFARRGLGYSADQGSPTILEDYVEGFDLPPFINGVNQPNSFSSTLRLYPVPAGNVLHVEAGKGWLPEKLSLYDAGGRVVRQWKNEERLHAELDLSGLADGFYLLDAGVAGRSRLIIRR